MKLTTLSPCSVGEADRQSSPLLQFLIQGNAGGEQKGVLYLCTELAVSGVDNNEQAWSTNPVKVYDTESSWEDDHTALHTESLVELFVENLGGASTLPAVFQLVDQLLAHQTRGRING